MNKINELINKLCPNGVIFYKLKELINFTNGKGHEKVVEENGNYILITSKAISTNMEDCRKTNTILTPLYKDDITMVMSDLPNGRALAKCFIVDADNKYTLNQRVCGLSVINKDKVLPKFLYYILNRNKQLLKFDNGVDQTNLRKDDILNISIPVPPMEVQNEIVHILDDFTLLSAELSAELKTRQKQYEYYRNKLLKYDNSNLIKFGDVAKIQRGASPRPISEYITDNENGVNWIKIGDVEVGKKYITACKEKITIEGSKKSRFVKKGDFILSNSMSFGRPYIMAIDGCIHDGWLSISEFQDYYIPDFLYYLLNSSEMQNEFKQKASFGGAVQNLNADIVRNIELPLVTMTKQKEIVDILDKFEKYINDIKEGLPAEIEARKKQYEYYRDKLLTFKELKVEN